jgi:methyl-accepting chemotaxis protein
MKGINQNSKRISEIIAVIDSLAFQTNILVLNAEVEAAGAGEEGRGFAVVASEVRNLAGRSAEAAREIKKLIGGSVERVEEGTTLVDHARDTMNAVVGSIQRVTDIVGEISAASAEQSQGVGQVGEAVCRWIKSRSRMLRRWNRVRPQPRACSSRPEQLVQAASVFKLA